MTSRAQTRMQMRLDLFVIVLQFLVHSRIAVLPREDHVIDPQTLNMQGHGSSQAFDRISCVAQVHRMDFQQLLVHGSEVGNRGLHAEIQSL